MSEPRSVSAGASILVVGGRGFVGSDVVRSLIARGYRVHVFGPDMAVDLLQDVRSRLNETIAFLQSFWPRFAATGEPNQRENHFA